MPERKVIRRAFRCIGRFPLILLVLFAPLLLLAISEHDFSLCGNELLSESKSPGGKYIASVFERNCGATTPYVRVVSLRSAGKEFDPEDNENWIFSIRGQAEITAAWASDEEVSISYMGGDGESPIKKSSWGDVAATYP